MKKQCANYLFALDNFSTPDNIILINNILELWNNLVLPKQNIPVYHA